jgi:hypothetical protein
MVCVGLPGQPYYACVQPPPPPHPHPAPPHGLTPALPTHWHPAGTHGTVLLTSESSAWTRICHRSRRFRWWGACAGARTRQTGGRPRWAAGCCQLPRTGAPSWTSCLRPLTLRSLWLACTAQNGRGWVMSWALLSTRRAADRRAAGRRSPCSGMRGLGRRTRACGCTSPPGSQVAAGCKQQRLTASSQPGGKQRRLCCPRPHLVMRGGGVVASPAAERSRSTAAAACPPLPPPTTSVRFSLNLWWQRKTCRLQSVSRPGPAASAVRLLLLDPPPGGSVCDRLYRCGRAVTPRCARCAAGIWPASSTPTACPPCRPAWPHMRPHLASDTGVFAPLAGVCGPAGAPAAGAVLPAGSDVAAPRPAYAAFIAFSVLDGSSVSRRTCVHACGARAVRAAAGMTGPVARRSCERGTGGLGRVMPAHHSPCSINSSCQPDRCMHQAAEVVRALT